MALHRNMVNFWLTSCHAYANQYVLSRIATQSGPREKSSAGFFVVISILRPACALNRKQANDRQCAETRIGE